jgi:hypothetical protein
MATGMATRRRNLCLIRPMRASRRGAESGRVRLRLPGTAIEALAPERNGVMAEAARERFVKNQPAQKDPMIVKTYFLVKVDLSYRYTKSSR